MLSTFVGSALTGAYWLAFFALAYGLTAGDYRPGSPAEPTDWHRGITAWLIWGSGFAVYVVLAWGWRRLDFFLARRRARLPPRLPFSVTRSASSKSGFTAANTSSPSPATRR